MGLQKQQSLRRLGLDHAALGGPYIIILQQTQLLTNATKVPVTSWCIFVNEKYQSIQSWKKYSEMEQPKKKDYWYKDVIEEILCN